MKINRAYKKRNLKKFLWSITLPFVLALWNSPFEEFCAKLGDFGKTLYYRILKIRFLITKKPSIPWFLYFGTSHCTLNCKQCNQFIGGYKKNSHIKPVTFDTFKKDIDKILSAVDYIYGFQIIGGEPLLIKDLPKMLEYAAQQKQIKHVFFATNCTIFPTQELMSILKKYKISVQLSDYRCLENPLIKYEEVRQMFQREKIKLSLIQEIEEKTFYIVPKVKDIQDTTLNKQEKFDSCEPFNYWVSVCNGLFYGCSATLYLKRNTEIKDIDEDILNIHKYTTQELTQEIIKWFSKPCYNTCAYCHFGDEIFKREKRGLQNVSNK